MGDISAVVTAVIVLAYDVLDSSRHPRPFPNVELALQSLIVL